MDITAYIQNRKKKQTKNGKYLYYCRLSSFDIRPKKVYYLDGKPYIRMELPKEKFYALLEADKEEYNDERSYTNPDWRMKTPQIRDKETGEVLNFWSECAVDESTKYIEEDWCARIDKRAALKKLSPLERKAFYLTEEGFNQVEISEMLKVNQSTVSRKLESAYRFMDYNRLDDGRSKQDLEFEVVWETFLRYHKTDNDEDMQLFVFTLLAGENLLSLMFKWFYTPKEFARYGIRYLMLYKETSGEDINGYIAKLSVYAQEFYRRHFTDKQAIYQWLYVLMMTETERRFLCFPEPKNDKFNGMEAEIEKLAKRREMTIPQYIELLHDKYEFRRRGYVLAYAKRFVAKTKDGQAKEQMKKEIAILIKQRKALAMRIKDKPE